MRLEVFQIEALAGLHLLHHLLRFVLIDAFLHIFDQRQHIAHAQNPAGHPFRVEGLQAGEFFAHADEFDRLAGDMAHRQRRAAARIAVQLGQDHPGQRQRLVKGLGGVHRILALHGVHHKQGFHRVQRRVQGFDFFHHRRVDGQTAGGIDNQHIMKMPLGVVQRGAGDVHRLLAGVGRKPFHVQLLRQQLELLDGGRAIHVGRHQQDFFLVLFFQQLGQLARGGGFTRPLQTGHQHDGRRHGGQVQRVVFVAHQTGEFVVDHADHRLARREAAHHLVAHGAFAHVVDERLHHRQRHIGFQQRHAHFTHGVLDIVLGQPGVAAQVLDHAGEACGEIVQHGCVRLRLAKSGLTPRSESTRANVETVWCML